MKSCFVSVVGGSSIYQHVKGNISMLQCVSPLWLHTCVRINRTVFLSLGKIDLLFLHKIKILYCISDFEGKGCPRVVEVKIEILLFRV